MLTQLPYEITYKILPFLSTSEILLCSQTCRAWYSFFKQFISQLETRTEEQWRSVLHAVESKYITGALVKSLKTSADLEELFCDFEEIPFLFPNLKVFVFRDNISLRYKELSPDDHIKPFIPWQHCLEELNLYGSGDELALMLEMCQFTRLKKLELNYYYNNWNWVDNRNKDIVISSLKHVPQLKSLSLQGDILLMEAINDIHEQLPTLQRLELYYQTTSLSPIPQKTLPATTLTHFTLNTENLSIPCKQAVLQYVIAKYPSLISLYLLNDVSEDRMLTSALLEHVTPRIEADIITFLSQLPKTLKAFRNQYACFTKSMMDALPPFHEIEILTDRESDFENATLDYCFSKGMFNTLNTLRVDAYHLDDIYPDTGIMTNLKNLHITCQYVHYNRPEKIFYLDRLFKIHPYLEECRLLMRDYYIDIQNTLSPFLHVKSLIINAASVSDKIMPFIRETMPGLKKLVILIEDNGTKSSDYVNTIHLPDQKLEMVQLNAPHRDIVCCINKEKYYIFYKEKRKVKYCSGMDNVNENYSFIDIQCKSLWHLKVNTINIF